MSEHLKPTTTPQSHAQTLREDAGRLLSRSPHPYHRQYFELPHPSERLNAHTPTTPSALRSTQQTDDEEQDTSRSWSERYRGSGNSDSGTEADDEHFLKGLPAPKSRPHKGLRGIEGTISGSASPLLTPSILDEQRKGGIYWASTSPELSEQNLRMTANKLRIRRRATIVRRIIEAALLLFLGGLLALSPAIRSLMWMWRKELVCQILVISLLIAIYPLRLLRYLSSRRPWKSHFPLEIPAAWDPAPLFYPPAMTMLVSFVISSRQPKTLLPSIILSIASLPKSLIPAIGELSGANTLHWFFSCLPFLVSQNLHSISPLVTDPLKGWDGELLVLLFPLHQALCTTLQYLTTTSLLAAELQLLSTALIELLLLSTSPQTTILKSLLWGGGVGLLVSCENVLRWGVALARVPKWRFRRARSSLTPSRNKQNPIERLSKAVFSWDEDDFSGEDELAMSRTRSESPNLKLSTYNARIATSGKGSTSAVERQSTERILSASQNDPNSIQRRHTLPMLSSLPPRSSKRTPSGRKKRAASSSVQSFFHLTQKQATVRKWAYAGYVYLCVLVIILVGIREYVGKYALHENEPVGWALGYLFGDIQRFRMEVVTANLQRWILLPPRNELEKKDSCPMGWVEHLRHATFGAANTRLILTAYWLAVIIVGLAIVFRLSAIYEVDTRRKVFHFMMVAMLLPATYVDPTFAALALSLVLAVFLLLDLFRASQLPPLSKSLAYFLTPYVDGRDLKGPVVISHIFLLIGCAIPLWLSLGSLPRSGTDALQGWEVPSREVSMVSGVICVGLGDAAASLIGRRYGRRKWLWGGGKSIEGSVAFATAVGSALLLAKAWLRIGGWPTHNHDSWVTTVWKSGVAAGVASLTEAVLTGGNDNVVVPIVLWLCVKGLDI